MKNLKKVLALVVALTMVLGTVGFAAYTDVAEDAGEYTAVSTLSSLSILTGYEDGSFKPDGDITRAEFATVVCRALGAKVSGSAVTGFTDVPADHWASAYIAYCAGAGIVNGMGDGTFAPSANVTVEQAVKMLVVALGYEPMAAAKGGYPTGYMVVANTNGITEGVGGQTAAATRADVAKLVYNALDVPMMVQDGFGTQVSFKVADGEGDNPAYQSLLTGLDVAKLEGSVLYTPIIGGENATDAGYVTYKIADDYDSEDFVIGDEETFAVAEGVNAEQYFGYASVIYVKELSRNKWEIIAAMPGEDSTTVELGNEDIDAVTASAIDYYTDANKYDTKALKLDGSVKFFFNYDELTANSGAAELDKAVKAGADVEVTVIENSGDNKFDVVSVKKYIYERVDSVEAEKDRFNGKVEAFTFDFEDEEKVISIVDKNGDAMDLADFAEDDVIAYISDNDKGKNYNWIEVINLGQNAVTGTVTEENDDAVYVDGTEYGLAEDGIVKLGDEGTFYLTRTGKIFDSEKSASVSGNYAYILGTTLDANTGWDKAWQIKMLTKDNEVVTYSVRDGFSINSAAQIDQDDNTSKVQLLKDLDVANSAASIDTDVAKRIVTFKLDSKGLIREINSVSSVTDKTDKGYEYEADAQYLFGDLEDDVVIFNISNPTETGVFATNVGALVNENEYKGYLVSNEEGENDCVIITDGGAKVDVSQDLAVVASVTDITVDEGATDAKKVRYYTAADETVKEIIIVDDLDVSVPADAGTDYDMVKTGAIMMFADDGNGTAAAYMVVANTDFEAGSAAFAINSAAEAIIEGDTNADATIEIGYIADYGRTSGGQKIVTGSGANLVLKNTTNTYTIANASAAKARVYVGDWAAVKTVDKADAITDGKATFFIAKKVKSTVADFITAGVQYAY